MNQVSTTGASDMSSSDPSRRISGDVPPAARGGCFDCNICLDFAVEPVVTRCGHLYCWPCIYEWLRCNLEAHAGDGRTSTRRPCPVCKAQLALDSLVPLYGRGGSRSDKPQTAIPRRPTVHREAVEQESAQFSGGGGGHQHVSTEELDSPTRSSSQAHHHAGAARFDVVYPPPSLGRGPDVMHSTAGGVLGGIAMAVLPWVFRGQVPANYSSPYHSAALQNMSPRLRRRHMEVEKSLHQLLFFLFVFVVLCLLLF